MSGTCEFLCPLSEVEFRKKHNLVHPLEVASCSSVESPKDVSPEYVMVKEYRRCAAGAERPHRSVLRPAHVLRKTVTYLLRLFHRERKENFAESYSFVSDRFRAVRQDMIIQKLAAEEALKLLESMIPFYIDTEYFCRSRGCKTYDWKLHSTQLQECLSRWSEYAPIVKIVDPEICTVFLLRKYCLESSIKEYKRFRSLLPCDLEKLVTAVMFSFTSVNFVRFFRLLKKLPAGFVRQSLHEAVYSMRVKALYVISLGFKSPPSTLPLTFFVRSLALEDVHHAKDILNYLNVDIIEPVKVSSLNVANLECCSDSFSHILYTCDIILYL